MKKLLHAGLNFLKREDGPTAVEYAVMTALIIVVCITILIALGTKSSATFTTTGNQLGKSVSS